MVVHVVPTRRWISQPVMPCVALGGGSTATVIWVAEGEESVRSVVSPSWTSVQVAVVVDPPGPAASTAARLRTGVLFSPRPFSMNVVAVPAGEPLTAPAGSFSVKDVAPVTALQ